ncbi:hypothetical protein VPHD249_0142 [Vibrio phage D249]
MSIVARKKTAKENNLLGNQIMGGRVIAVRIKRKEFLNTVRTNRAAYVTAQGLIEEAIDKENLEDFEVFKSNVSALDVPQHLAFQVTNYPTNHTSSYDKVIRMAELSCDDIVELTDDEFDKYIMNSWPFIQNMKTMLGGYASTVNVGGDAGNNIYLSASSAL